MSNRMFIVGCTGFILSVGVLAGLGDRPDMEKHDAINQRAQLRRELRVAKEQHLELERQRDEAIANRNEAVRLFIETRDAKTPFEVAQRSPRTDENIEVVVDGQIVHLVGLGAESVLPYFGPIVEDTTNAQVD